MKSPYFVVIGRGIAGLTLAYRLAKAGHRVTVLAPKNQADAASAAAVGLYTSKGLISSGNNLFAAKVAGIPLMHQLVHQLQAELGRNIPFHEGVIEVFADRNHLRDIRKRIYHNKFSDHLAVEILGFAELNERLPAFHKFWDSCTNGGALWYPKDFWIDPPSLLAALDAALRMLGASFLEETVTAVNGTPEGRFAVVCQRQTLEFDYVALAAGAGIGAIEVGSQSVRLNFLSPVPGWTYEIEVAETCHPLSISEGRMALNAFGRNIRLGSFDMGKLEHALGSDIPSRLSQQISGAIGIALPSLFFEGKTATDLRVVSGTRVLTPDRWPIVGPFNVPGIPVDKLWILTGFHKVGFYLADMAARGMVQFLEQGSVGGFFPYFSPRRFFPRLNV